MTLQTRISTVFEAQFGAAPRYFVQAPGRVNLIGEHTDYNDGFVLPCAINYQTLVAATPRDDDQVRVVAADYDGQTDSFTLSADLQSHPDYLWANYIRGVLKHLILRGHSFQGMDMAVTGNVPQGAGLSSSASLEVAIGQTVKTLAAIDISQKDIALNGQEAENQFVGCNCGIMDQLISAEGEVGHALLIDCRSLDTRAVSIPEGLAVVIIDSKVKRGLVDSEYNTRREQCETAAQALGLQALRDISLVDFEAKAASLDPLVAQRARHVVSENERTLEAADALAANDLRRLGELMAASHASMRDDFEITVPQIDFIVASVAEVLQGNGGVRMTGGGFGGCIVALVPEGRVDAVRSCIEDRYFDETGLNAEIHVCTPSAGAGTLA